MAKHSSGDRNFSISGALLGAAMAISLVVVIVILIFVQ